MNFLAHLYLADINNDSPIGQLLGDFVKGRAIYGYNSRIQAAVKFHRKIDSFCDTHPITRISRNRVAPRRRRFAGIVVDLCYDHFLAHRWRRYHPRPLADFTRSVYAALAQDSTPRPEGFAAVLSRMIACDWLGSYVDLDKVALALDRTAARLSRGERFKGGIDDIVSNYRDFRDDFDAFFPRLVQFSNDYCRHRKVTFTEA